MSEAVNVALLTSKLSSNAGGLSVSVPIMAHGIDKFSDINMHVFGTIDPEFPMAYQEWGPRVKAFPIAGPTALQRAPDMMAAVNQAAPDLIDVQGIWTWSSRISHKFYQRHKKPYVVTPRGMLDPWALSNSKWKKRAFSSFIERAHLNDAFCFRATASMEAEHFRALGYRCPIAIIPNAIEIPELTVKSQQTRRKVLFLSRIHPKKGIDLLMQAWRSLQSEFLDWELVIAGIDEGGYENEIKQYARRLGLSRVSFPGAVFGAEKEKLYRTSDLFVLPTHAENFGLVVAEALAREVPVITTKNAPWSGLCSQNCGWWIDLDISSLTDTMREAMTCPMLELQDKGKRGRQWMTNDFGVENTTSALRDLYLWVSGRGPRPEAVYD